MNDSPTGVTQPAASPAHPSAAQACDVLIVGGGINGAGIARDLAGRGLSVVLCEKDDLAAHTSSASTKMIHGGIRYLEYYDFLLVRKALAEREVLLRSAPHIMRPLRLVVPHDPSMRPVWMMRIGLFLYDHLARREFLPGSRTIRLRGHTLGAPLNPRYSRAFLYSDGWTDDARLVVLNALDAAERGAQVLPGWRCIDAQRDSTHWQVTLQGATGTVRLVRARALVNAAGPWAAQFLKEHAHAQASKIKPLRLVKGSHIVVPKLFDHDHAYALQGADKRVIFIIPYEGDYTLIGTTDVEHKGPAGDAKIDDDETRYLCEQASRYMVKPVAPGDVVWSYSGVRPLIEDDAEDPSAVTRDYLLELDTDGPPLLTVWGGKITTFRKLAEDAADGLCKGLGLKTAAWTAGTWLPGGDLSAWIGPATRPDVDFARFEQKLGERHPALPVKLRHRLARCYGARIDRVLGAEGLGEEIAPGLHEGELVYLHDHEWARTPDDVLWRRTKLGLHMSEAQRRDVARWWATRWPGETTTTTTSIGDSVRTTTWS
ncbi:glycerol-3-phosphate dehydrogenase [Pelomonas sp. Root1237]|uniref:glycerol-3-phosphate dehydrogenase n=1 Tax=Pelomonas sp. Root1237 TaxID=1736434 RepID=UPI00190FD179